MHPSIPRLSLVVLLVVAMVAGADARRRGPSTGLGPIAYGKPPPDFGFPSDAGPTTLRALRGTTVVVDFWATYCAPCIAELDAFAKLPAAYANAVTLVMVSDEPRDRLLPLLAEHGVRADVLSDPERTVFARYGVTPIPTTLVVAPDGTVAHVSIGELDWTELSRAIDAARAATAAPGP